MKILACLLSLLFQALLANGSPVDQQGATKSVMCYFEGISAIRPQEEARFTPEDIDVSICTHVVYNRALVNADLEVVPRNREVALLEDGGKGIYNRTLALKNLKPELQVFIDVYDNERELGKHVASGNRSALSAFAKTAADFVQRHGFDGMNFRVKEMKEGFEEIAEPLRAEFSERGLTLMTIILFSKCPIIPQWNLTESMSRNFDLLVVASYWNLPFEQTEIFSSIKDLEDIVDEYTAVGIPADKLVMAIPAFGVSYTLCDNEHTGVGSRICDGGNEGIYESETEMILHSSEMMRKMANKSEEWVVARDPEAKVNYGYSKSLQWVSFEDPESVRAKAEVIMERGLRGAAIMNVDMEDFKGAYTEGGETFPLTRTAFNALNGGGL